MTKELDTALTAVRDAGPEPAANDVAGWPDAIGLLIGAGNAVANLAGMTDLAGCQPDPAMSKKIADWDRLLPDATAQIAALQDECARLRKTLEKISDMPRAYPGASRVAREALAAQPVEVSA